VSELELLYLELELLCLEDNSHGSKPLKPIYGQPSSAFTSLPADLRLEPDTAVFKCKLKSYLFHSVFTQ